MILNDTLVFADDDRIERMFNLPPMSGRRSADHRLALRAKGVRDPGGKTLHITGLV